MADFRFSLIADFRDRASKAVQALDSKLEGLEQRTEAISRWGRRGLVGLAAGLGIVTAAASEQEEADNKLKSTLESLGEESDQVYQSMKKLAGEMGRATTYGDEQVQMLIAQAYNYGVTSDEMDDFIKNTIGLAEATDMKLTQALRYAKLALEGEYTRLQQQIPQLQTATSESEKLAIVQQVMARGFEQAAAKTETLKGAAGEVKERIGDLMQAFAGAILGTDTWGQSLSRLEAWLNNKAIPAIESWNEDTREWIRFGIKATAVVLGLAAVLNPLVKTIWALTKASAALKAVTPEVWAITAMAAAVFVLAEGMGWLNTSILETTGTLDWFEKRWNLIGRRIAHVVDLVGKAIRKLGQLADIVTPSTWWGGPGPITDAGERIQEWAENAREGLETMPGGKRHHAGERGGRGGGLPRGPGGRVIPPGGMPRAPMGGPLIPQPGFSQGMAKTARDKAQRMGRLNSLMERNMRIVEGLEQQTAEQMAEMERQIRQHNSMLKRLARARR